MGVKVKLQNTHKNYAAIDAVGATPYIAFKSIHSGAGSGLWAKMFATILAASSKGPTNWASRRRFGRNSRKKSLESYASRRYLFIELLHRRRLGIARFLNHPEGELADNHVGFHLNIERSQIVKL
jgi:hypothetical protein